MAWMPAFEYGLVAERETDAQRRRGAESLGPRLGLAGAGGRVFIVDARQGENETAAIDGIHQQRGCCPAFELTGDHVLIGDDRPGAAADLQDAVVGAVRIGQHYDELLVRVERACAAQGIDFGVHAAFGDAIGIGLQGVIDPVQFAFHGIDALASSDRDLLVVGGGAARRIGDDGFQVGHAAPRLQLEEINPGNAVDGVVLVHMAVDGAAQPVAGLDIVTLAVLAHRVRRDAAAL